MNGSSSDDVEWDRVIDRCHHTRELHRCQCPECVLSRSVQEEEEALDLLQRAIENLADAISDNPFVMTRGDGKGGWINQQIRLALERRGITREGIAVSEPRSEVVRLAERDGWDCAYCGCTLDGKPDRPRPHVDHVIPKSRGGSNALTNKVLACPTCNASKGARTPQEWAEAVAGRVGND